MPEKVKIATIEFTAEEWQSVRALAQKKNKKADLDSLTKPSILRLALGLEIKKRGGARPNTGNRNSTDSRSAKEAARIDLAFDSVPQRIRPLTDAELAEAQQHWAHTQLEKQATAKAKRKKKGAQNDKATRSTKRGNSRATSPK